MRREGELLREHEVVVEQRVDLIRDLDHISASGAVRYGLESDLGPRALHGVERLQRGAILSSS